MTAEIMIDHETPPWRFRAPKARSVAQVLYGWSDPAWAFCVAILASTPFLMAAAFSPAYLSLAPTVEPIADVANARALANGAHLVQEVAPLQLILLKIADQFTDAPGKIHLLAKTIAAILAAYPLAYFATVRLPTIVAATLTAGIAAFIVSPFSTFADIGLAFFVVSSSALLMEPADDGFDRAMFEGVLLGALLFAVWLLNPIFTLAGIVALSICPFVTGRSGFVRYAMSFAVLASFAVIAEVAEPGINLARANLVSAGASDGLIASFRHYGGIGVTGIAITVFATILSVAIFGGVEHARGWVAAGIFLVLSMVASLAVGAQPALAFALAASFAVFSVHSPFYDGIFKDHDRASVALSLSSGLATVFWFVFSCLLATGQLAGQWRVALNEASPSARALAIVHPSEEDRYRWSIALYGDSDDVTVRREQIDQSEMIFEAAELAERIAEQGQEIAFLTGGDLACVFVAERDCMVTGRAAAAEASVVLVPRLTLSKAASSEKSSAEAFLYTQFRLADQTRFWEMWVRRDGRSGLAKSVFRQGT